MKKSARQKAVMKYGQRLFMIRGACGNLMHVQMLMGFKAVKAEDVQATLEAEAKRQYEEEVSKL